MVSHTNLLAVLLLLGVAAVSGTVYEGSLDNTNFGFLGKFAFGESPDHPVGTVQVQLTTDDDDIYLFLYDDEASSWPLAKDAECTEAIKHYKSRYRINRTTTHTEYISEKARRRYWYAVAAKLDCSKFSVKRFWSEWLNIPTPGEPGSQFGSDEEGLLPMTVLFFCVWFAGMAIHFTVHIRAASLEYSTIIRCFHISMVLMFLSLLCNLVHYTIYSSNGIGSKPLLGVGHLFNALSIIFMWIMLAFLALGFGISKATLGDGRGGSGMLGMIAIGGFSFAYGLMTLWYYFGRDPAATNYIYDSAPGIAVLVVQVIYMLWWLHQLYGTWGNETTSTKRYYYVVCGLVFTTWFASTPVVAIVAAQVDNWVRLKVVEVVTMLVNTIFYAITIILFWPSRAEVIFKPNKGLVAFGDAADDDAVGGYSAL